MIVKLFIIFGIVYFIVVTISHILNLKAYFDAKWIMKKQGLTSTNQIRKNS